MSGAGAEKNGVTANVQGFLWGDENTLNLDSGAGCIDTIFWEYTLIQYV